MRPGTPGFIGARLREAREARGLNANALADLLGVTRMAVSKYENGHQSPAPQVMDRICVCLNLPMHFFTRSLRPTETGTIFYRSMSAATKSARSRAERRYEWLREIVAYLQRFITFPKVDFPTFELPNDPRGIRDSEIEELATATRRHWNLGDGPISNLVWLLENNGAIATRVEFGTDTLDAFSEWREKTVCPFVVLSSDKQSAARSRHDAAHELGHLVMHRHLPRSLFSNREVFTLIEKQAHRFAGAFHLPAQSFAEEFYTPSLDALRSLKAKWRTAISAMIMRAGQLKLISQDQERRLWINLARRKWRTVEPLDDVLEPERPRFLRRCFDLLIDNAVVPPEAILHDLALPANDVEQLAGLPFGYFTDSYQTGVSLKHPSVRPGSSGEPDSSAEQPSHVLPIHRNR